LAVLLFFCQRVYFNALDAKVNIVCLLWRYYNETLIAKTRIQRWGCTLALRIPKPFAEEAGIEPNSSLWDG